MSSAPQGARAAGYGRGEASRAPERPRVDGASGALTVEVIDSREGLDALRKDWNALVTAGHGGHVFLTHEWVRAWWETFGDGKSLHVLLVTAGTGSPVGIAPLYRARARLGPVPYTELRLLGGAPIGADYMDVVADPERRPEVLEAVLEHLATTAGCWDLAVLDDVLDASATVAAVRALASRLGLRAAIGPRYTCPFIRIPDGATSTDAVLETRLRKNLRRYRRLLEERGRPRLVEWTDVGDLDAGIDLLFAIHRKGWSRHGERSTFDVPQVEAFHRRAARAMLERGNLRLYALVLDAEPIAALYGFRAGSRFLSLQTVFDPAWSAVAPGSMMRMMGLQRAIDEGVREYDLMRGSEGYKSSWARESRRTVTLCLGAPTPVGRLVFVARRLARGGVAAARRAWTRARSARGAVMGDAGGVAPRLQPASRTGDAAQGARGED